MLNDFTYLYKSFTFTNSETNVLLLTHCMSLTYVNICRERKAFCLTFTLSELQMKQIRFYLS